MGKFLQDVVEVPQRPGKPRTRGKTMVIATPLPDGPSPTMRLWAEYVDVVKFTVQCLWLDEEVLMKNIEGFRKLDMDVQIGGVPYEIAMMQGKQQEYLDKMKSIGATVIEVENHASEMSLEEMKREIDRLRGQGFTVVGEVGAKWFQMDDTRHVQNQVMVERVINKMKELLDAGADHLYWEGMVIRALIGNQLQNRVGQRQIIEVVEAIGLDKLFFEVWDARKGGNSQFWGWFVHQFGPDVNFANINPEEVAGLESVRRGCIYDPAHPYLRWLSKGKPTKHYWQMEMPDYDNDIQPGPIWR